MHLRNFLAVLVLLLPSVAHAIDPSSFRSSAEIVLPEEASGAYSFVIPPPIATKVNSESEIRIFDAQNKQLPYVMNFAHKRKIRTTNSVRIFNSGTTPNEYQSFELRAPNSKDLLNRITLLVKDENFTRTATLLAKESETDQYQIVKEGMRIVRMTSKEDAIRYSHTHLTFPPQAKLFYKVQISLSDGQQPLEIEGVRVSQRYDIASRRQDVVLELRAFNEEELAQLQNSNAFRGKDFKKHSLYRLSNPLGAIALDTFTLQLDQDQFTRRAQLFTPGRKGLHPLQRRGTASIFRYGVEQNLVIELTSAVPSSDYVLAIAHGDNLPFEVRGVVGSFISAEVRFLFESGTASYQPPFRLLFDADVSQKPSFDIAKTIRKRQIKKFQTVALGKVQANPEFKETAAGKAKKAEPYLLYVAIGLLVLVLGWYLIRLVQAGPPPDSE